MYEACPNVLKRATAPLKALPILTKNYSKIRENPTHNWVVGLRTLCICGSPPPSWVMDSIYQGNGARNMAIALRGTGSKSSWRLETLIDSVTMAFSFTQSAHTRSPPSSFLPSRVVHEILGAYGAIKRPVCLDKTA
jgi:hypothetical protein